LPSSTTTLTQTTDTTSPSTTIVSTTPSTTVATTAETSTSTTTTSTSTPLTTATTTKTTTTTTTTTTMITTSATTTTTEATTEAFFEVDDNLKAGKGTTTTQGPDLNRTERPPMIHPQLREVEVKLPKNSVIVQIPEEAYDPFKAFLEAGNLQPKGRSGGETDPDEDELSAAFGKIFSNPLEGL